MKIIWRVIITIILSLLLLLLAQKVGMDIVGIISGYLIAYFGYVKLSNRNF